MATKAKQQNLVPDVDDDPEVTPRVQKLANKRKDASIAKSQANEKFKAADSALLDAMKEDGIERVKVVIDGNPKWYHLVDKELIKEENAAKKKDGEAEEE